ncbi:MAG: hypothetical protein GY874_08820 [Desulfobacteraceae bacterium]|nr:hypothetical protein [Desulfobacteraceae bacterium]
MKNYDETNDHINNIYSVYVDPKAQSNGALTEFIGSVLSMTFYPLSFPPVEKLKPQAS